MFQIKPVPKLVKKLNKGHEFLAPFPSTPTLDGGKSEPVDTNAFWGI